MISIATTHELVSIVESLLSGNFYRNGDNLNARLMSFMDDEISWELCLNTLLQSNSLHISYFVANMVHSKAKSQWISLSVEAQKCSLDIIYQLSLSLTQANPAHYHQEKPLRDKIFAILSVMCLSSEGCLDTLLDMANSLITQQPPNQIETHKLCYGLNLLQCVASEAEILDLPRSRMHAVQHDLRERVPDALQCFHRIVGVLSCGDDVALSLLHALQITASAIRVISDVICMQEYPKPADRYSIIVFIINRLLGSSAVFACDDFHSVCLAISTIAEQEVENLAAVDGFAANVFEFLLRCTSVKPRTTAVLTFDFWIALQDIPVQLKHSHCKSAFGTLVDILYDQLNYPDDFDGIKWRCELSDEEEDFATFRNPEQGIDDLLHACYFALGDDFFRKIAARLWNADGTVTSWRNFETALFILCSINDEVKQVVSKETNSDAIIIAFLDKLIGAALLGQPPVDTYPQLCMTTCKFFGTISYVFSPNGRPSTTALAIYFPRLVSYLCACLTPSCSLFAAQSLLRLSNAAAHSFHTHVNVFTELTTITSHFIMHNDTPVVVTLATALGTAIASLDNTAKMQIVEFITRAISEGIVHESVASSQRSILRLAQLLRVIYALIKHSENFDHQSNDGAFHFLLGYASARCNEQFQFIINHRQHINVKDYDHVIAEIFLVLSAIIKSKCEEKWQYISQICGFIVNCCSASLHASCLQCAYDIVEEVASRSDSQSFLFDLLQNIVNCTINCIDQGDVEIHAAEKLYEYLSLHFILSAQVITLSSQVLQATLACTGKLLKQYSEIHVVRSMLVFVQHCFTPIHSRGATINCQFIVESSMLFLPLFTAYILDGLDGAVPSSVWPYLADTMYVIVSAIDSCQVPIMYDSITAEIHSEQRFVKLQPESRRIVSALTLNLAGKNKRKFKTAYVDIGKVCAGEMNSEMLSDYT